MNLATKVTVARIMLIIPAAVLYILAFCLPLYQYGLLIAACVTFSVLCATDFIDGTIARKTHTVSNLGKFLDPIADKVLVSTALIVLLTRGAVFGLRFFAEWGMIAAGVCVAVILARELIVSGFRMIAAGRGMVLAADKLGKIKTVFQDLSIALILGGMSFLSSDAGQIVAIVGIFAFYVCTVLTIGNR